MGAPKDRVQTFPFHPHICCVCLETGERPWGLEEPGETGGGEPFSFPSPLPLPFSVCILPPPLPPAPAHSFPGQ